MSRISDWAEEQKKSDQEKTILEIISDSTIYALSSFIVSNPEPPKKAPESSFLQAKEHYCNDVTLFEVGCYLYQCIELWYFKNNKEKRMTDFRYLVDQFICLFQDVLALNNLNEIYENRAEMYGRLIEKGDIFKDAIDFYLPQLILRVKDAVPPKNYDFEKKFPVFIDDGFVEFFLKTKITGFTKNIIPGCYRNLEMCYKIEGR